MIPNNSAAAPLVSVVMATFSGDNCAFLQEAVESILLQTYGHLEFIIVLNGPVPADVEAYLKATARQDGRVRLIMLERNLGVSYARNQGIVAAKGAYIAIMDADDIAAPERIMRQYEYLTETGADLAGSFYYIIDEHRRNVGKKEVPVTPIEIRRWLYVFCPLNNPTVCARAAVFKENLYDETFRCSEDYNLWIRLIRKGYVIRNQPEYLLHFRRTVNFISKRSGWALFVSDLKNKLAVLSLYRFYTRPFIFLVAMVTVFSRLMPAGVLKFIYWTRNKLRFDV